MDIVHDCCAGIDVHKKTIVLCVLLAQPNRPALKQVRSFPTLPAGLQDAYDWLLSFHVTHVALESTGVYWKPIYEVLEGHFTLLLVNAQHIKAVPGRKTDLKDAEWIAQLLQHGLLRPSFVPDPWQRHLRELTRSRTRLVQERGRLVQRIHQVLETAHLKLTSILSDVMGVSAQAILHALLAGQTDPHLLAQLARGRLRSKRGLLEAALQTQLQPHHVLLLQEYLVLIDGLDEAIAHLSASITQQLQPHQGLLDRLQTIPGIGLRLAEILLAELGVRMDPFPSAKHLASWAGMCPGNHESAGKRKQGTIRSANRWLRSALTEAAQAAAHSKDTYLSAQYRRLAARRGAKKATIALGHSILVIIYHLMTQETDYQDLGANYYDEHDRQAVQRRLVRRLEQLGYGVVLTPAHADAV
ncbi:MAG TPA: IS110 family transposase [Ktedonobacteraceae bacterium]|nr:IS110 family transposase [Ktedonobacteraceae bacterium]